MLGYTQKEMALLVGCSRESYLFKEKREREFSKEEQEKIHRILRERLPTLTMEDLFPIE